MSHINLKTLASKFNAWNNCVKSNNIEWMENHAESIDEMLKNLPSGSGIDNGMQFDWNESKDDKLVFHLSFHHMEEGYYSGWTEHKVIITPSLIFGYNIRITGRDKNEIKVYLIDLLSEIFTID